ncbi:MAG: hypothetical protein RMZ41_017030 [Nostoc sp. DedVER02]|uniref:hypothetical protein n=1 Tax=unclassified Nostoc TaxID=2593658 RepID=UPI002AD1DE84|nr:MULTISPECIES: hypothetical protein [unclassified Nostoc]MDZ7986205.1 hypothetical protein [Nostoc sp. DedVER02]MDZ8113757.1 hypothetical protein [Nostoc sp. DedVER01b]
MIIANRTEELRFFNQMVQGSVAKRVLLIEAKSGLGKTQLLARFKHTLPQNILSVQMDLKTAQLGIPYVFSCVRKRLGNERFPHLNAAVGQYLKSGIEVSNTTMIGKDNQLSVVLSNVDESTRNFRLTELREAFFYDLRKIPQTLVFLFDSYEKAITELADWLGGEFLTEVVDTEKLIVVIAGQKIPQPTIEWMDLHHCCRLKAISEAKAWYEYTQQTGLRLNQDQVTTTIQILEGQPALIVQWLETLARERQ